jgi:glycosyltransferase involved in cell wall biosynthesis
MMNICCFSRVNYWHGIKGGMDLHGRLLAEGMVERGHSVSMISTRHPSGRSREENRGVDVFYLPDTVFGSRRKGWAEASVGKFIELHQRKRFDVIWSQSFDAFGLAGRKDPEPRVPVVATLHGSIQQEYATFRANIGPGILHPLQTAVRAAGLYYSYFKVQKPLLSIADRIITVSPVVAEDLGRWYGKPVLQRCTTVVNGVDAELFRPDEGQRRLVRQALGFGEKDVALLTMGRLTHEKGHHLAIRAAKSLLEANLPVRLAVVGDGPERDGLRKMVRQCGLENRVAFTGRVDNARMAQFYNGADIVLMPTLTVEGLPFVLLEAMSCARPVIASRIGGTGEVVKDGENGLLVEPGSLPALADAIMRLVNDSPLAARLGEAARATILADFSLNQMVDRTLRVMAVIAADKKHRAPAGRKA